MRDMTRVALILLIPLARSSIYHGLGATDRIARKVR
jgi:hypothetical protein